MKDLLSRAVDRVVASGNCTGCGGCALVSGRVSMELSDGGFLRPRVAPVGDSEEQSSDRRVARQFSDVCPGTGQQRAHVPGANQDEVFGPIWGSWNAWATDESVRRSGSSGGVLTALSKWLLSTGQVDQVHGASACKSDPCRTASSIIRSAEESAVLAGSRYAPVSVLSSLGGPEVSQAMVAKPCEVAAARRLRGVQDQPAGSGPIMLSFFCAGTPSQKATGTLVERLGRAPVRYQSFDTVVRGGPDRSPSNCPAAERRRFLTRSPGDRPWDEMFSLAAGCAWTGLVRAPTFRWGTIGRRMRADSPTFPTQRASLS